MTAAMQNPASQSLHSDLKYIIFFQSKCYFSIQWASSFSTNWINLKLLIQKGFLNASPRIQHDRRDKESSSFPVTISCVHRPTSALGTLDCAAGTSCSGKSKQPSIFFSILQNRAGKMNSS